MNWDTKTVMKFLELYQINSCIWDPQHEYYKNRQYVNDAWHNIMENLGISCTIKDLKKKKESLMAAYRNYKTKIKKSELSGSSFDDVYKPTWFAYSFMDSFLGSVYICNTSRSTEDEEVIEDTRTSITNEANESIIIDSKPTISHQESITPIPPVKRRQKNPRELVVAKQYMENAFNFMQQVAQERHHPKNEKCSIFGHLVARKIRKLSEKRRDIMMVGINQLCVDERIISPYSSPSQSINIATPSPSKFLEVLYSPQAQAQSPEEEYSETVHYDSSGDTQHHMLPNTIYDGPADTFKDFVIYKAK